MSPDYQNLKGSPKNGVGMIQNLFLLSRNSVVEFFSDTEAVVGSNPTVTTKKSLNVKWPITAG